MGVVYWSPLCTAIGILNLLVFIVQQPQFATYFNWQPYAFNPVQPQWYQYITSIFLHGSWEHLTANAFYLFAFGCVLENKVGSKIFFIIYFIAGIGGNVIYQIFGDGALAIGASGAIFGIICSMVFADPKAFVVTPGAPIPVPILLFALLYIGKEFIPLINGQESNISHISHIGGGAVGAIVASLISGFGKKKTESQ